WASLHFSLLAPRRFADLVDLEILFRIVLDRLAGLGIDAVRPVDLLGVLLRRDELPVVAVQRVEEAVTAEMRDNLAILAAHFRINQLIDAHLVIIEEVAGCVLEIP